MPTTVIHIGPCSNCGRSIKLRARGLCGTCYKFRSKEGYIPKIEAPIAKKLHDEWWHFKDILGREMAIHRLAQAFHCSPVTIRSWVEENDHLYREAVAA